MPKTITVPAFEEFNERTSKISFYPAITLRLEHSLLSISQWESIWHISFFDSEKTEEQTMSYIKCMTLTKDVKDAVYRHLTFDNIKEINDYIRDPMTATTIRETPGGHNSTEFVTSELVYYWMISYNIPVEFERWHINRLIMLIRVCSEKQKPQKKMSRREILERNRALNAARRAKYNSKG